MNKTSRWGSLAVISIISIIIIAIALFYNNNTELNAKQDSVQSTWSYDYDRQKTYRNNAIVFMLAEDIDETQILRDLNQYHIKKIYRPYNNPLIGTIIFEQPYSLEELEQIESKLNEASYIDTASIMWDIDWTVD